jgi:hypothetical protein
VNSGALERAVGQTKAGVKAVEIFVMFRFFLNERANAQRAVSHRNKNISLYYFETSICRLRTVCVLTSSLFKLTFALFLGPPLVLVSFSPCYESRPLCQSWPTTAHGGPFGRDASSAAQPSAASWPLRNHINPHFRFLDLQHNFCFLSLSFSLSLPSPFFSLR